MVISEKNIVEQINVVVHFLAVAIGRVNIAVVEWSFLGLNICFDNMQFKYTCISVYNSVLFQLLFCLNKLILFSYNRI